MGDFDTAKYVGWEEVFASGEEGKREVRYFLRDAYGKADLVIVGKENSWRHMSYRFVMKGLPNCHKKLKCRGDVVDWIHSVVSDNQPSGSHGEFVGDMDPKSKINSSKNIGRCINDIRWLGSPWACRKKQRHYKSFCRNGAVISTQDFVYVLAEEGKRLVAYIEDLYEDSRGNKMVVVRWFHKFDEVGFISSHKSSDREIFYSLCLQDLKVECIDGLATILSPEHYEKYFSKATTMGLMPFMCLRMFDNNEVKQFDITTIKGYWKQEILRKASSSVNESSDDDVMLNGPISDAVGDRRKKRIRCESYPDHNVRIVSPDNTEEGVEVQSCKENFLNLHSALPDDTSSSPSLQCLTIGSQVEVLSQDSGIRGCWFRGLIVNRIKNKVKVRYQDLRDAIDSTKYVEEWISAFRVALPDEHGIRVLGRRMVRPCRLSDKVKGSYEFDAGSIIDAWWHDGWWEGIVVKKECDKRLIVYFPGERQEAIFSYGDLRHSMEWADNSWQNFKKRPELVPKLSGHGADTEANKSSTSNPENAEKDPISLQRPRNVIKIRLYKDGISNLPKVNVIRDLRNDELLSRLRWRSSGKKRTNRRPVHTLQGEANSASQCQEKGLSMQFYVDSSIMFDTDNCKYAGDPRFSSSAVTNLVMSQ